MNHNKKVDLIILAGGKGKRIKKFLKNLPKPMVKFNRKHFLIYLINKVSQYNFNKIYILTGYKSNIIHKKFHQKEFNFLPVTCLKEKKLLGTGGALRKLNNKINDFVLMNGDTLFDIDLKKFINSHKKNFLGSIALTKNLKQKSSKLNRLSLKGGIISYNNKGNLMNGGIYFFKRNFLKLISKNSKSLENDVLPNLISKKKISGKFYNDFFLDIGSKIFLNKASKLLIKNYKKPAVFLDRDGVINYDYGYVHNVKNFKFRRGVIKGLKYLTKKNYHIFIVTNQAGIGKRKFTLESFKNLHKYLKKFFLKKKISIRDVQYSPFHKKSKIKKYIKNSKYRKPGNLMIKKIFENWDIVSNKSFMIGDKKSDKLAAKKSNLKFYYAQQDFFIQIKNIINNY